MIRADFHVHTTFSNDSQIPPKTIVEQLVAHPTIKVVAVTDHGTVQGLNVLRHLAKPYPDIVIVSGVEITTPKGDIIILGTEELPPKPWTVENVVDFANKNACVSVAVHPFREWGLGDYVANSGVDAVEVLNGGSSASANKRANDLAKVLKLPGIAGSDAHQPIELFSVYTEVRASLNTDEILSAIKKGLVSTSSLGKSIRF